MIAIHTILHPTDFTEQSVHAFHVANGLAHDYGAHLIILHVARSPFLLYAEADTWPTLATSDDEIRAELAQYQADPAVEITRQVEHGDPAEEILNVAKLAHADMIVMGAHGRSRLARLVMGSVTSKVMKQAACPVLTVRLPFAPAETSNSRAAVGAMAH